ncbi:MAG: hypothetical protein ACJ76J_01840 [Thermoanaerobaculia bacterium]
MTDMTPWFRFLRTLAANEPFLPALRPYLLRFQGWIADLEAAPRELRRRRARRFLGASPARSARRAGRAARSTRRAA